MRRLAKLAAVTFLILGGAGAVGLMAFAMSNHHVAKQLLVNYLETLAQDQTLAWDTAPVQRQLNDFASEFEIALDVKSLVEVRIDDRLIASYGKAMPEGWLDLVVSRSEILPNGKSLGVFSRINFDSYWFNYLNALLALAGGLLFIFFMFYLFVQSSLRGAMRPLESLTDWMDQNSHDLRKNDGEVPPILSGAEAREIQRASQALGRYLRELRRLHNEEMRLSYIEGQVQTARQVSHDIRSPLSALRMVLAAKNAPPAQKDELISSAVQRITAIAEDLLSETPASATGADLQTLAAEIQNCVRLKKIERPQVDIDLGDFPSDWKVAELGISAKDLGRIVSNLINNSCEAQAKRVGVFPSVSGDAFEMRVQDDGEGMSTERLRDPGAGRSTKAAGHGLGLSNAARVIRAAGGQLSAERNELKGTTIRISLPRVDKS
ncbi:MAG TPA: HAMP domain-containing sensor histidine kinase [Bdellovibrionales bacterium]|nr:HAMP domain-containing sensor histidine kinase [Bdellovibrionales bacterium]